MAKSSKPSQASFENTSTELEDRIVLFADLLGVSDAAKSAEPERAKQIVALLGDLADRAGPGKIIVQGGIGLAIPPAVSTFSDHIVMSYPLTLGEQVAARGPSWPGDRIYLFMLSHLKTQIGLVARDALKAGFLLRGALTRGKLSHPGKLVFGEGLVRAFEIESRTAHYPRIVITEDVCDLPYIKHWSSVLTDVDGLKHLDYFEDMLRFGERDAGPDWRAEMGDIITKNLEAFDRTENMNALGKWAWFKAQFEIAKKRYPP